MKLSLGFSPCPNDCFIFDALVNNRIDTQGMEFDVVMADVEELNRRAFAGNIDITKLSYHAYVQLVDNYVLLNAGSALGFGVGPLVISKSSIPVNQIPNCSIAIPGKHTTANFLFSMAFPGATNKKEMLFSEIQEAVLSGKTDAGVIIHENRFTYEQKGLKKVIDLGEWWEKETGSAIPLGGIAARRDLPSEVKRNVDAVIRRSVEFAFANPDASRSFVKQHAQEMSEEVMRKHINLYVNKFSVDLGEEGRRAVNVMLKKAVEAGIIDKVSKPVFLDA